MAVYLSMRQVRDEICKQAGERSSSHHGPLAARLLGRFFHEIFAELVGQDARWNWSAALVDQDPQPHKWREGLIEHGYRHLVSHRLQQHRAELLSAGEEVCAFWEGVRHLCDWIVESLWKYYQDTGRLLQPHSSVICELPLELELKEAGWIDSVRLTDIDDTVWRTPGGQAWCVVELALGEGRGRADMIGQACLYHMILRATREQRRALSGPLAIMTFRPSREEQRFETAKLDATQKQLKLRIGQMAGVVPNWLKTTREPPRARELPPEYGALAKTLIDTLQEFGAAAELSGPPIVGPTSLRFSIIPGRGVPLAKVKQLADAIKLRLRLKQAPLIDGSGGQISIDIERPNRPIVFYWPS